MAFPTSIQLKSADKEVRSPCCTAITVGASALTGFSRCALCDSHGVLFGTGRLLPSGQRVMSRNPLGKILCQRCREKPCALVVEVHPAPLVKLCRERRRINRD